MMNQQTLMHLLYKDREAAFRQIYLEAFPRVARMIARRGGQLEEAEDVFHEALIIVYEKCRAQELQINGSVAGYITGICRHRWSSRLRERRRETLPGDLPDRIAEAPGEPPAGRIAVFELLEQAGKKCMDMLQAVYYFRYSMQEVAEEFGFRTVRSATVQKYKCLEKVRREAKKREDEVIAA